MIKTLLQRLRKSDATNRLARRCRCCRPCVPSAVPPPVIRLVDGVPPPRVGASTQPAVVGRQNRGATSGCALRGACESARPPGIISDFLAAAACCRSLPAARSTVWRGHRWRRRAPALRLRLLTKGGAVAGHGRCRAWRRRFRRPGFAATTLPGGAASDPADSSTVPRYGLLRCSVALRAASSSEVAYATAFATAPQEDNHGRLLGAYKLWVGGELAGVGPGRGDDAVGGVPYDSLDVTAAVRRAQRTAPGSGVALAVQGYHANATTACVSRAAWSTTTAREP